MKIKVIVSMGLVGCRRVTEFDVDDNADEEAIEEIAGEAVWEMISWHWEKSDGKSVTKVRP